MKIIINCQEYPDFNFELQQLRESLPGVDIKTSRTLDPATFVREACGAVVAMVQYVPITRDVIDALPECRGYIRNGIGYNNLDAEYAASCGKYVANVPDYCIDEVSNHAFGMILALNRRLVQTMRQVMENRYRFDHIRPVIRLADAVLGIVGLGRIGKALATKARPFVSQIDYFDPYVDTHAFARKQNTLEALFAQSDVISLHTPLNEETRGMVNLSILEKIRPHGLLINTSRGGIVDESALLKLLRTGKIGGAGFDVFAHEPIPSEHPFLAFDNTIVTPHTAWYSESALSDVRRSWVQQAIAVARGDAPEHQVSI